MKPSIIDYFFAHCYKVAMSIGAVVAAIWIERWFDGFSFWCAVAIFLSLPLACILGAILFGPLIFAIGSKINGAPFREGDLVHILSGPHRNHVGRIYEMWPSRKQVRIQISAQAKKDVSDVFL